jgi:3-oxoacyl-[acyl-carrier protein] reductase
VRTAVVTGGTGTLGRAVALALARDHRLVLVGRDPARGAAAVAAVRDIGGDAVFVAADLTDPAWPAGIGEVDVFVHGAAAYAPYARVEAVSDAAWREVLAVGPDAAFAGARAWLPGMRARGFGRVILVGSAVASLGGHGQAPYAAAKAALVGLARTLALEGGAEGVTANVVEVGLLDHPRTTSLPPEGVAGLVAHAAVPRLGRPEEVAAVVAFLAGDAAAWVSGACWAVGGGLGLRVAVRGRW